MKEPLPKNERVHVQLPLQPPPRHRPQGSVRAAHLALGAGLGRLLQSLLSQHVGTSLTQIDSAIFTGKTGGFNPSGLFYILADSVDLNNLMFDRV